MTSPGPRWQARRVETARHGWHALCRAPMGEARTVLALHGFGGSSSDFLPMIDALDAIGWGELGWVLPDLPGHGGTTGRGGDEAAGWAAFREGLDALVSALALPMVDVLGYSMGARHALVWATGTTHPLRSLTLIGGTAGLRDPAEAAARRASDEALAARIVADGVAAFADAWEALPLIATQRRAGEGAWEAARARRRAQRAEGLAASLRDAGTGTMPDLSSALGRLRCPALLVVGEEDTKFRAIADDLRQRLPEATACVIPAAGHAAHLEDARCFARALASFLQRTAARRPERSSNPTLGTPMTITWQKAREFSDIHYEKAEGIAKITINRPEVRNAFRPQTVHELEAAFADANEDGATGVVILTGAGDKAFCSGGDQRVRGHAGYVGDDGVPRLNILRVQKMIRSMPKPVIAMVNGYAIGGGHVLHVVCDLSIASDNAIFGQTGPRVGSFDGGFGASYLARLVGQKKAREIWYLCRQYNATEALEMGLVNKVVPLERLEEETVQWCREILANSHTAIRLLKSAFNAELDGQAGIQELAGNATLLFYMSEEAQEAKNAYLQKRKPDFSRFPRLPA